MNKAYDKATIDRFEGDYAVLEFQDKTTEAVHKSQLAAQYQEGDKLIKKNGIWIKDEAATEEARKRIRKMMDDLWE